MVLKEARLEMLNVLSIKQKISPICKQHGVKRAYLFGSYARGDATDQSDIDIRIEKGNLRGLLAISGFQIDLEKALAKKVDLITVLPQEVLYDILKKNLMKDEVLLYESERD